MSILTFEALPAELTRTSPRIELLTGNILFTEGSAADSLFVVETGCVRLVVQPHDGKQLVLYRARDGELFAEDHLVRLTYSFTAIADKRTVLRSVNRSSLLNYITKKTAGLMLYLKSVSDRYNQLRMNYERLGLPSAKAKVLQMLVTMTDGGKRTIDLTGRFKTLAADLNLTHETMYRALTALEQQDAIHRSGGLVSIVQPPDCSFTTRKKLPEQHSRSYDHRHTHCPHIEVTFPLHHSAKESTMKNRPNFASRGIASLFMLMFAVTWTTSTSSARGDDLQALNGVRARFTSDGKLIRPEGWRKWIYVGTPLTPHDMNNGQAAFPEFHNVYVDPESFASFERTGKFPNGTQIVKELTLVGSKSAVSGNGYFMGEFSGLEIAIKDSVRFKNEPGGWAYFSFGHVSADNYTKTAKAFATDKCNACHQASADLDYVFTQYYPVLRAALPNRTKKATDEARASVKTMDDKSTITAVNALGSTGDEAKPDDYGMKLFAWLQRKGYKNYRAESATHLSSSGAAVHGDVRVFVNHKLDQSMQNGNTEHPTGSVAVKELHKDGKLYGWAAMIKARDDDGQGNGWYWYENLSTTDATKPVAASLGHQMCVGCHSPGKDFVRTKSID